MDPLRVLGRCSWEMAGEQVGASPHTIYRILNHMTFWQDLFLVRIGGEEGPAPELPSEGWPGELKPANEAAWDDAVASFQKGFDRALQLAKSESLDTVLPTFRNMTLGESLVFLAQHNNHHLGQIITLCQALGYWPQPSDVWGEY